MQDTRRKLVCNFVRVQSVFDDCLAHAQMKLSDAGVDAYIEGAQVICKMGRGEEPVLAFLEEMPLVAAQLGEEVIAEVVEFTRKLARTPNSKAIPPFLQSLAAAARHLESRKLFIEYLQLVWQTMERTSPKVHGIDSMYTSECLPEFLKSAPFLLGQISLGGLKNWVDYGIKGYPNDPERQRDYFMLQSADSRAVLQRERHGTLLTDHERKLDLYLRGLWGSEAVFMPYSLAFDQLRKPAPYLDDNGIHLPDVYDERKTAFAAWIATARCLRMSRRIGVGPRQSWLTISVRSSASPSRCSRIPAWNGWRCASIPACANYGARCIPCRRRSNMKKVFPISAIAWRCCRARCWIQTTAIYIHRYSNMSHNFMR